MNHFQITVKWTSAMKMKKRITGGNINIFAHSINHTFLSQWFAKWHSFQKTKLKHRFSSYLFYFLFYLQDIRVKWYEYKILNECNGQRNVTLFLWS
jgi:hypothetical protein